MTSEKELINKAKTAVGKGDSETDWKIEPTVHAGKLEKEAPTLAENLQGSKIAGIAEKYEDCDDQAKKAQDKFKSTIGKADTAIFFTATFGALLLIVAGIQEFRGEEYGKWVFTGIGILGLIAGGLASTWLAQVKKSELSTKWTNLRAKAEAKRLSYFKSVLENASKADTMDQLLAFEYTRRYLLDNQIDYFRDRGRKHEKDAEKSINWSTWAVFISSITTGVAGFLAWIDPQYAVIAGFGAIASAFSALMISKSVLNGDSKNADRYGNAYNRLSDHKLDIDEYRNRISKGDYSAISEFYEVVFVVLKTDHNDFLTEADEREIAIGNMEKRLDTAKRKQKEETAD